MDLDDEHKKYNTEPDNALNKSVESDKADESVGKRCPQVFGVAVDGGLIPIFKLAARLCQREDTHLLFLNDRTDYSDALTPELIKTAKPWKQEFDDPNCLSRFTHAYRLTDEIYEHFKKAKLEKDQHIFFKVPSILKTIEHVRLPFLGEEFTIDGRS